MNVKKHKENEVVFAKDNTIIIFIKELTYERLEQLGKQHYKDKRNREGLIRAYAMIRANEIISMTNEPIPIHSELFVEGVSKRNYVDFLAVLERTNMIRTFHFLAEHYKDKKNQNHIKKEPNHYQTIDFSFDFWGNKSKLFPVKLSLKEPTYKTLAVRYNYIRKHYNEDGVIEKRIATMTYNKDEIILIKDIVSLIKNSFSKNSKRQSQSLNNIISNSRYNIGIEDIEEVIKRIDNKEQYIRNNLNEIIDNKTNTKLEYYNELKIDIRALDECLCLKDLKDLANINKIPQYGNDGKIYSTFARIRRPIRKHITFRGEPLVEVSDIRCAHFTMLPKIFDTYGIKITPWWEMNGWKTLTQRGDLYSEVVEHTDLPRDFIKPTFQSFFSIKNENSYLYGGREKDAENRRILCRWFRQNYPNIYKALIEWHKTQKIKIKRAANRVESEIMNSICDELRGLGLHPFRLHDAIYLPQNEVEQIPFSIKQKVFDFINNKNMPTRVA